MQLNVENDFQQKIMYQAFSGETAIASADDVQQWRSQWMGALSSWHSPYKAVIDCSSLKCPTDAPEVVDALERMIKFFKGFFLKKVVGYGTHASLSLLPFEVFPTEEEAATAAGIRQKRQAAQQGDFRSSIQIQNHFQQHTVEVTFAYDVSLDSKEKLNDFRTKLTNNLMQWHSKWNLMLDCSHFLFDPKLCNDFRVLEKFLQGLFLKQVIGYSPKSPKEDYPFPVYRSRHKAAALLEAEGNFSGDEADCNSRKL